ncbi:MAG: hypothetical protein ACLFPL_05115 [Candidatus Nanoarchaeia archaeon]
MDNNRITNLPSPTRSNQPTTLEYNDNNYVNEGQSNSISDRIIQNEVVTSSKIASNLVRVQELDTNSVDNRYVNRAGDTITCALRMNGNDIENAGDIKANKYCDENGNNCFEPSDIEESGSLDIF